MPSLWGLAGGGRCLFLSYGNNIFSARKTPPDSIANRAWIHLPLKGRSFKEYLRKLFKIRKNSPSWIRGSTRMGEGVWLNTPATSFKLLRPDGHLLLSKRRSLYRPKSSIYTLSLFEEGHCVISNVCFMRNSAALVYNLQASLHCTRWHELCDDGNFSSPKECRALRGLAGGGRCLFLSYSNKPYYVMRTPPSSIANRAWIHLPLKGRNFKESLRKLFKIRKNSPSWIRGTLRNKQCLLYAKLGCARLQFASKLALYSLARALRRREL